MTKKNVSASTGAAVVEVLHDLPTRNLQVVRLSDGRVAYVFDATKKLGPSKSGKTTLVSTTAGALRVPGLPVIAANVYQ